MNSYNIFAEYYDLLTENAEYEKRCEYICNFFDEYGSKGADVLDLACGTGKITALLSEKGYNVTGLDLSSDMLTKAKLNSPEALFFCGDMTDFDLGVKFDKCLCSLDAVNHLSDIDAVKNCFKCVYNSLKDNGVFVFDANTIYKHKYIIGDKTFVFDEEDFFLSWDNILNEDASVEIFLDFFVKCGDVYRRYSESFTERAYESAQLKEALEAAGFSVLGIYDDLSLENEKIDSQRIYFVSSKRRQK